MNALAQSIRAIPAAYTDNGVLTYSTSSNPLVDLFFVLGSASLKTTKVEALVEMFNAAYRFDKEKAIRILLWTRDVRGGAGRRELFRKMFNRLEVMDSRVAYNLVPFIPEYGRADDILIAKTPAVRKAVVNYIIKILQKGLIAKNKLDKINVLH